MQLIIPVKHRKKLIFGLAPTKYIPTQNPRNRFTIEREINLRTNSLRCKYRRGPWIIRLLKRRKIIEKNLQQMCCKFFLECNNVSRLPEKVFFLLTFYQGIRVAVASWCSSQNLTQLSYKLGIVRIKVTLDENQSQFWGRFSCLQRTYFFKFKLIPA